MKNPQKIKLIILDFHGGFWENRRELYNWLI